MYFSIVVVKLCVMVSVIILINLMKHWQLLLLPSILEVEYSIKEEDQVFYIMLCYMAYFYGMMAGTYFWTKIEEKMSSQGSILISLLALGVFNFMQGTTKSISGFAFIRFCTGFSCNVNKIGSSYVHEQIPKEHRKTAFFINSGSGLIGTVSGPFVGHLLNDYTQSFMITCFLITMAIFLVAICNVFVFMHNDIGEKEVQEEAVVLFKRHPSTIGFTMKHLVISCFWTNLTSRKLILCFLINSSVMQSDFVLTSLLFTTKFHGGDYAVSNFTIGLCEFISAILGLFSLGMANYIVPRLISYKFYIMIIIAYSIVCTMLTPFIKFYFEGQEIKYITFYVFYILKYVVCYFLYTSLLRYFINLSIFKPYRKPLNIMLGTFRSMVDGMIFNLLIPLFLILGRNSQLIGIGFLNYGITFLIFGALQFYTLTLLTTFKMPREEAYMTI